MLNEYQVNRLWENMLAAETRAFYFGDLATRYTRRKQFITGASFVLSSGAAATIIANAPPAVPALLALLTAVATAYAMATNLDGRITTMAKLHSSWTQIGTLYERLWNHTDDPDAEDQLLAILERESGPSEVALAVSPIQDDDQLLRQWQDRVFALHHIRSPA